MKALFCVNIPSMKLAILFWFYKEPEICENRLQLLKKHNPNLKIFGLYGGKYQEEVFYREKLGKYLDDFFTTKSKDEKRKWIHGDLSILEWFNKRGMSLEWDSIVVIQWDMLVLDSLLKLFQGLGKDQIYFSGLRRLNEEIESRWSWTSPEYNHRKNYLNFKKYIKDQYNYGEQLMCCLYILEVLPKIFLEKFLTVQNREIGMLEYKDPTYAKIFGLKFFKKDFGVLWFQNVPKPLNAHPKEIETKYIQEELAKQNGWRIFHPYYKMWD